MVHERRSHRLPVLILLAAGLATGVACGGSGSGSGAQNGVASIKAAGEHTGSDTSDPTSDKEKNDKAQTNPEDAMLAFARCMRENGVDMPDPDTSGGAGVVTFKAAPAGGGQKIEAGSDAFEKAHAACKDLMGDAGPMKLTPEQEQEMHDQALAFARCMREHGVNMPDPSFGGEGQVMMKIGPDDGLDPNDAEFQNAQQACGSAFGPAGGKGGPGLSVGGGQAGGTVGGGEPRAGTMVFGSPAAGTAGGGAK